MKIGIVTDSPSDLPADVTEHYGIEVVPAVIIIEGRGYIDGVDITREEFYTRLPGMRTPPSTAAPSPLEFASRYRKLLGAGCEHVLSIHTASRLTAIANIARKAADEFFGLVTVLDSTSLSLGVGFQAQAAAETSEAGKSLAETLQAVESTRQRVRVSAALDTMEYVRRSGRIPATVATLGGMLNIKPVVEVREGQVRPIGAARTTSQATVILLRFLAEQCPLERFAILHTNALPRANEFLDAIMASDLRRALPSDIHIVNVTGLIGTHVGPYGLGFAAVKAT